MCKLHGNSIYLNVDLLTGGGASSFNIFLLLTPNKSEVLQNLHTVFQRKQLICELCHQELWHIFMARKRDSIFFM